MTVMAFGGASSSPIVSSPAPAPSLDRARIIALKAEPEPQARFRVPPFAQSMPEEASENIPEVEADIAGRRVA